MTLLTLLVTGALAALLPEVAGNVKEEEVVEKLMECDNILVINHPWGYEITAKKYESCRQELQKMIENYVSLEAGKAGISEEEWLSAHAKIVRGLGKYKLELKGPLPKEIKITVDVYVPPKKVEEINERHSHLRDKLTVS